MRTITAMWFRVYVLTLPLFTVMWALWLIRSSSQWFACYVMVLPLLYGYVVPGIATNVLKKWRFKGPLLMGNYFVHHGFIYSANMSALLFPVFIIPSPDMPISVWSGIAMVLSAGALHGFALSIIDVYMQRAGMLEVRSPPREQGKSAEEVVFSYGPMTFFLLGATYTTACVLAYNELVVNRNGRGASMLWLLAAGFILMLSFTSLAYGAAERRATRRQATESGRTKCR